ncbi:hypothetical protein [Paraburkholderia acidisoli]|nr:hypothetical protein [Paraburkholderia acidisoli]
MNVDLTGKTAIVTGSTPEVMKFLANPCLTGSTVYADGGGALA